MTYTCSFQQFGKNDVAYAGGKGANLGELTMAGFPVPPGFVLTTKAYDAFVQENGLQQKIVQVASCANVDVPQSTAAASAKIQKLFHDGEVTHDIADALLSAYADLKRGAVAVRSSATAEDLPTASFAGQQDTYLNVQGDWALLEAVKQCWASLWTARAMAYRARMAVDHDTARMAVVVQRMVPAEVSGILFTANPTTGERDELVVNAAFGLGEAVVSGAVAPDTYVLDRGIPTPKEATLGAKEVMIVAVDGQEAQGERTITQDVPQTRRKKWALSDVRLSELATLGVQVEKHFGGAPQDIEWAVADGRAWLLQARPITNLPPPPLRDVRWEPPRPGTVWMRRQVVEHMPEPLSPLFDELYLQEGLDQSLSEMADFIGKLANMKIELWEFIQPPFAATVNGYAYSIATINFRWQQIALVLRLYTAVLPKMIRHMIPYWRDEVLPAYRSIIERWKTVDLANATDEELLRGVRELAVTDAGYWNAAAVPLGMARVTDTVLDRFLKWASAGRDSSSGRRGTSGAYLRGFPSKSVEAQAQLETIAKKIHGSENLREQVVSTPAIRLLDLLAEHPEGQPARDSLEAYLDQYGHQIYNLDFVAPTQADDPLPVLLSLKGAVEYPERDALALQAQLAQERESLVARTERSLNPLQRRVFRLLLGWAQHYTPYREEALFYVGAAWPALRRLALELGRRLTEAGSLNLPDDVFFLKSAELTSASVARAQGSGRPELADLARKRRQLREAQKRLDPPISVPPGARFKIGPIDMAMFEPQPRSASEGPTLNGYAVSPGRVTAAASVIRSPQDFYRMKPDTILVCTTTTPAWTPLFAQAKGLVTDIGGALAHGSIVAREYGIPAVMGTGVATQRIESGQRIQVDGDSGTVTLLDEVDAALSEETSVQETEIPLRKVARAVMVAGAAIAILLWWRRHRRRHSSEVM